MTQRPEPRESRREPSEPNPLDDVLEIGDRFYVLASGSLADENDRVLKHGESFAVFDRYGNLKPVTSGEEGVFHQGTRHLSGLVLRLGGERPLLLGSTAKRDNSRLAVDLTNPDMRVRGRLLRRGLIHLSRTKVLLDGTFHERIVLRSFGSRDVTLPLSLSFAADFRDIFEVRGVARERRGTSLDPRITEHGVTLAYDGLDGIRRRTRLRFDPPPSRLTERDAAWELDLPAGRSVTIELSVGCEAGEDRRRPAPFEVALETASGFLPRARERAARITSSSELFNDWLDRSAADIVMMTTDTPHGPYPYAGVPWFSSPFGRDGLITALQMLWLMPDLARGVLSFLAATQATHDDPLRDAEPGKILHEMRLGEMAATGEVPFGRYYGSHDATPLFVMLAAAYVRQTGDTAAAVELWPAVAQALDWIEGSGDPDGDGFMEYATRTPSGLPQQGWKDSYDSVFTADGRLAKGPIAMCEIQGYAYAARLGGAELAEIVGQPERAAALRIDAEGLRQRFEERFWLEDLGTYAIALDGRKRACRVRTSNPGHCLMTGIVAPDRAGRVAETLMADASFSGWGIRTLAAGEARYNPMSYHDGSVWPHDTAMIALGLARYGFRDHAAQITGALFDASRHFDLARLPELFCGFTRREGEGPTLYPVACSPQAWAAGAVFMLLQACLGLETDASAGQVRFDHARLPLFLDWLRVENLRVGEGRVDVLLERQRDGVGINILGREGDVEVVAVR